MTLSKLKKDFELPKNTKLKLLEILKKVYSKGYTHTYFNFKKPLRKRVFLLFNPWNMKILTGKYKNDIIIKINGLSYSQFYKKVRKFTSAQHRNKYNINFVRYIFSSNCPFEIKSIKLENNGLITRNTLEKYYNRNTIKSNDSTYISKNNIYLKNFVEDLTKLVKKLQKKRDLYDTWNIYLGSGGNRKQVAKLLNSFFNPKDIRSSLLKKIVVRQPNKWCPQDYIGTNTTFLNYAFQNEKSLLDTYKGKINIYISNKVGSASYIFAVICLLINGKYTIKNNVITTNKESQIQFIGSNEYNRVSNCYNGEDGGEMLEYTTVSLARPYTFWINPKEFLIGYTLVGH